jgi:uncharacterized membrane protein YeaQ/YmgE (transglycosylase-associated protein family)
MTTFTLEGLIVVIVTAALCGAVGLALAGGGQGGRVRYTTCGVIGAVLVPWLARECHLSESAGLHVSGHLFPIAWSIIGAALLVAILYAVSARRRIVHYIGVAASAVPRASAASSTMR